MRSGKNCFISNSFDCTAGRAPRHKAAVKIRKERIILYMELSKSSKIRILIKYFVFVAIFFVLLSIGSVFLDPVKLGLDNNLFEREEYLTGILGEDKNTIDVVVLGDSESFGLLSPMHLWQDMGIASYIAGQGGQRTVEEYYALKKILKHQKPKLVILETNNVFDEVGFFSEGKFVAATTVYHYFPLVKYHSVWKNIFENNTNNQNHFNGFEIRANIVPYTGGDYIFPTEEVHKIDPIIQYYYDKTIDLCKENNIDVLLTWAPSPIHFSYDKHNAMQQYADKNNIPFIDMNILDDLNIDLNGDMLDGGDHINIYGSIKVTKYLEEYFKNQYELPDRRNDSRYTKWNERCAQFMEQLSKVPGLE